MAGKVYKDSNNKIWVDGSAKILTSSTYSDTLVQSGLVGDFTGDNVELVNGYIKTIYNNTGGTNFVQNNIAYQTLPVINEKNGHNGIYLTAGMQYNGVFSNIKQIMVVMRYYNTNNTSDGGFLFTNSSYSRADGRRYGFCIYYRNWIDMTSTEAAASLYVNNKLYAYNAKSGFDQAIATQYTFDNNRTYNIELLNSTVSNTQSRIVTLAFCFYSRVLSDEERIHNFNVYSQRYNIALEA